MALGLLLRLVQHIAYGYSLHTLVGRESFLQGVTAASDLCRLLALCACGVEGLGWWLLYQFERPHSFHQKRSSREQPRMPFLPTVKYSLTCS
jgi:hypothetical protein